MVDLVAIKLWFLNLFCEMGIVNLNYYMTVEHNAKLDKCNYRAAGKLVIQGDFPNDVDNRLIEVCKSRKEAQALARKLNRKRK